MFLSRNELTATWELVISYLGVEQITRNYTQHAEALTAMTSIINSFKCLCRLCISRFYLPVLSFHPHNMCKIDRLEEKSESKGEVFMRPHTISNAIKQLRDKTKKFFICFKLFHEFIAIKHGYGEN